MGKFNDLTGEKFGRLTVLGIYGHDEYGKLLYRCRCNCGNERITHGRALKSGHCRSCGCLNYDVKIEMSKYKGIAQDNPRLYTIWKSMNARCFNERHKSFKCFNCNSYFNFDELYKHRIAEAIKPKTNADHIRSMTDEELAKELWAWNQICCHKWKAEEIAEWLKEEYVSDKEEGNA